MVRPSYEGSEEARPLRNFLVYFHVIPISENKHSQKMTTCQGIFLYYEIFGEEIISEDSWRDRIHVQIGKQGQGLGNLRVNQTV